MGALCGACGLNRKSFYYRFKDKYDLVEWIFNTEFVSAAEQPGAAERWSFLQALCGYLYRERAFYARIFRVEGQNSFRRYFSEYLFCATESFFRPGDSLTAAEQENYRFFITFLRDAILAAVIRWLTEGSRLPPEEFVSRLHYISDTIDTQVWRKLSGEGTPCP